MPAASSRRDVEERVHVGSLRIADVYEVSSSVEVAVRSGEPERVRSDRSTCSATTMRGLGTGTVVTTRCTAWVEATYLQSPGRRGRPRGASCWAREPSVGGARVARSSRPHSSKRGMESAGRVVVIGGGMAGVTAANELHARGIGVSLLEASDRLGGRIHTVRDENGVAVEHGATWLHGRRGNPLFAKAKALGILPDQIEWASSDEKEAVGEDEDENEDEDEFWAQAAILCSDGSEIDRSAALTAVRSFQKYVRELEKDPASAEEGESLGDFVERRFASEHPAADPALRLVFEGRKSIECSISGCSDLGEVSASQFLTYDELDEVNTRVPRGMDQLVASAVPAEFDQEVVGIRWGRSGVRVSTRAGRVFDGDYAVVALPLGVLQRHIGSLFDPCVPDEKAEAVAAVAFGVVDKVTLRVDLKLGWASRVIICGDDAPEWMRRAPIYTGPGISEVSMWLSGDQALQMEALPEEAVGEAVLAALMRSGATDGALPTVERIWRSKWGSNPLALGSYSFPGLRTAPDSFSLIQAPLVDDGGVPRVFFAGEACHPTLYSTMTGAFVTGRDAAKRIEEVTFGPVPTAFRRFRRHLLTRTPWPGSSRPARPVT